MLGEIHLYAEYLPYALVTAKLLARSVEAAVWSTIVNERKNWLFRSRNVAKHVFDFFRDGHGLSHKSSCDGSDGHYELQIGLYFQAFRCRKMGYFLRLNVCCGDFHYTRGRRHGFSHQTKSQ